MRCWALTFFIAGSTLPALAPVGASPLEAQAWELVQSVDDVTIVRSQGPEIGGSKRPAVRGNAFFDYEPLRYAWYAIQDSAMGLVFDRPSGAKNTVDGVDGDLHLLALRPIRAFEVRIMTFDIWRQRSRTLTTTELDPQFDEDGRWTDYDPRWSDALDRNRHMTVSIVWIANVMDEDGRLWSSDGAAVREAAAAVGAEISAEDLMPRTDPDAPR